MTYYYNFEDIFDMSRYRLDTLISRSNDNPDNYPLLIDKREIVIAIIYTDNKLTVNDDRFFQSEYFEHAMDLVPQSAQELRNIINEFELSVNRN